MKTLKCDMCDATMEAETFGEWMEKMKPHYAEAHADIMKSEGEKSKEEQMAAMQKWMAENQARFEAA